MEALKNLKYFYIKNWSINSTFLSSLEKLMNFHVMGTEIVAELFKKQPNGRTDLKNFYCGCLLKALDNPAIDLNFFIAMKTLAL